ncbi:MAG: RND family efflux transporter MFP subunit [Myxococcota bacterium]|jgi:RND family efflux transporter MFP subunit
MLMAAGSLAGPVLATEDPLDCVIEPHQMVSVSSSEIGVLGAVHVDKGDRVSQGQPVAALRTEVEEAALKLSKARAAATSELALLRSAHEHSARNRERNDALSRQRMVSAQKLDEVRTETNVALLRLRQAEEKYGLARLEVSRDTLALARRLILSPLSGVVVERFKSAGEYVEGDPIVRIAQLDPLRVELVAPISMYGKIRIGSKAIVTPELPIEGEFVATVTRIDPLLDAATATFGVRLSLPNPEHRLPPGLKCTLSLNEAGTKDATAGAPRAPTSVGRSVGSIAQQNLTSATTSPDEWTNIAPTGNPLDTVSSNRVREASADEATKKLDETTLTTQVGASGQPSAATSMEDPLEASGSVAGSEHVHNAASVPARALESESLDETDKKMVSASVTADTAVRSGLIAAIDTGKSIVGSACWALGPLRDSADVSQVASTLERNAVAFNQRELRYAKWVSFAVLSPKTSGAVTPTIDELKHPRIGDYSYIYSGRWTGRVSFGFFSVEQYAKARLKVVQRYGYEASVVRSPRARVHYWFDLHSGAAQDEPPEAVSGLLRTMPSLTLETVPCSQFAVRGSLSLSL